jgi:hypothetical protein
VTGEGAKMENKVLSVFKCQKGLMVVLDDQVYDLTEELMGKLEAMGWTTIEVLGVN